MTAISLTRSKSFAELAKAVHAGLPIKRLDEFQRHSALPWDVLSKVLRLPQRTLARRRKSGRLSPTESDRLLRISQIYDRTVTLLDGDGESATAWFLTPNRTFQGETPLATAKTEIGAAEVEQLLGRLEHGVFS